MGDGAHNGISDDLQCQQFQFALISCACIVHNDFTCYINAQHSKEEDSTYVVVNNSDDVDYCNM